MDGCNCSIVTSEELKALLDSDQPEKKERALAHIEALLTSRDADVRAQGYALLEEGINDALFCSCLNYRSLVGGFTHPLLTAVRRALEAWAHEGKASETSAVGSGGGQQPNASARSRREPTVGDLENREEALLDPASFFERPEDVLTDPNLGSRERVEILCRWAYDAASLAVAEEEGMAGGEASNLGAVVAALHRATGGFDAEHSGPTKQAGFCVLRG